MRTLSCYQLLLSLLLQKKKIKTGQTVTVTENNKIYLSAYQKQQPLSKAVVELVNF